jgi:hypothetical protein
MRLEKNKKHSRLYEIDDEKEEFNIPEEATIELSMSPVQAYDLYYIKYTDDFQSFVDVSLIALFIYISTEIYISLFDPKDEINLSVVWCSMVLIYGMASLASIAKNYLRTEEGSLLYVFACFSFMLSLLVQMADTKFFDFNIREAYYNLTTNAFNLMYANREINLASFSFNASSKHYSSNDLLFSCSLATISGFIGALLFFPSFRLARLHNLCLKYSQGSLFKRFLFYLSFIMPLLIAMCWFKPFFQHKKQNQTSIEELFKNLTASLSTYFSFTQRDNSTTLFLKEIRSLTLDLIRNLIFTDNLKIYLIILLFIMRILLYKYYAQSYLNLAFELASSLRKKSTRITNLKYISTISSIYQYYGVVASQYVMPLFVLLFLTFLLKTLGDFSWCGEFRTCTEITNVVASYVQSLKPNITSSPSIFKRFESSHFNITQSHNALNVIFTPFVLKSIIGYFTCWTSIVWFLISSFGLFYYNYLDQSLLSN